MVVLSIVVFLFSVVFFEEVLDLNLPQEGEFPIASYTRL